MSFVTIDPNRRVLFGEEAEFISKRHRLASSGDEQTLSCIVFLLASGLHGQEYATQFKKKIILF